MAAPQDKAKAARTAATNASRIRTGQVIFGDVPEVHLPGYGPVKLKFRNRDLGYVERVLTPLLDGLPGKVRVRSEETLEVVEVDASDYANVWEALELLGSRYPMDTMTALLTGATAHAGIPEDVIDDLPPSVLNDPNLEQAMTQAIAVAFGAADAGGDAAPPTEAAENPAE